MVSVDLQQLLTNLLINMNIHLTSFSHAPLTISNITTTHYLPLEHATVLCSLNISRPEPKRMEMSIRKFRNIDIDAVRNDIFNLTLYTSSFCDLDLLVVEYEHVSTSFKDKHAP